MKIREIWTKNDNETLCEIRVLGVLGTVAVIGAGFLSLPAIEIGGGIAAIITAIGGAIRLRNSD
jgi:hypothetical protein